MAAFLPIFGREFWDRRRNGWEPSPRDPVLLTVGFWPGRGYPRELCLAVPTRRHWSDCQLAMVAGLPVQILCGSGTEAKSGFRAYAEGVERMLWALEGTLPLLICDLDACAIRTGRLWWRADAAYVDAWRGLGFDTDKLIG